MVEQQQKTHQPGLAPCFKVQINFVDCFVLQEKCTLPETKSSHLKMDDWKISFLWGLGPFSGAFWLV